MSFYRQAKASELRSLLRWLKQELTTLLQISPEQHVLIDLLRQVLDDAERELAKIDVILSTGNPILLRRVDVIVTRLEQELLIASNFYVAGLQRQTPPDGEMRNVLIAVAQRLHLDWIEDFLVRLSRPLAIYARYQRLASIPVFYAPPHLLQTVMELPGIYHELGHSVFAKYDEIAQRLEAVVKKHFDALKRSSGPLPPEQKDERDKQIDSASRYWNRERLSEMFCDVFGSYVCGSANITSMLDLGMRGNRDPFEIHESDEHPPEASRMFAARCALDATAQNQPLLQKIFAEWIQYERQFTKDRRYKVFCADELLTALTEAMVRALADILPDVPRYGKPLPTIEEAIAVAAPIDLEDLISAGVTVLFERPEKFSEWQETARALIA